MIAKTKSVMSRVRGWLINMAECGWFIEPSMGRLNVLPTLMTSPSRGTKEVTPSAIEPVPQIDLELGSWQYLIECLNLQVLFLKGSFVLSDLSKMHLPLWSLFVSACLAVPILDRGQQQPIRPVDRNGPYTRKNKDPYDHKVDSYANDWQPLPWRNGDGASMMGPRNRDRERQNPDMLRPPSTDHGSMPNMRWSFADSHVRIEVSLAWLTVQSQITKRPQEGGWTRQTTVRELGTSKELAGVNMRLDYGVIRELHWHKEAEWAYVLEGNVRITALDTEGGNFIDDLQKGDLWYFPPGHPHSLQGLSPNGTEFLLVFDDGNFNEESTFLLTDWLGTIFTFESHVRR